jgi:hypothetical protein
MWWLDGGMWRSKSRQTGNDVHSYTGTVPRWIGLEANKVTAETYRLRAVDLTWRVLDDEVVVLDLRTSSYFSVNDTGKVLWDVLVEGASEEQLVTVLVDRFGISEDVARRDVGAFLSLCSERELLMVAGEPA